MHLTKDEERAIREQLTALRDDLERRIQDLAVTSEPVSLEEPIGRLSRIDAIQDRHMARAGLDRLRERLERVTTALELADEGRLGVCARCGGPIGFDRLEFEPESEHCVRCAR